MIAHIGVFINSNPILCAGLIKNPPGLGGPLQKLKRSTRPNRAQNQMNWILGGDRSLPLGMTLHARSAECGLLLVIKETELDFPFSHLYVCSVGVSKRQFPTLPHQSNGISPRIFHLRPRRAEIVQLMDGEAAMPARSAQSTTGLPALIPFPLPSTPTARDFFLQNDKSDLCAELPNQQAILPPLIRATRPSRVRSPTGKRGIQSLNYLHFRTWMVALVTGCVYKRQVII